MQTRIEKLLLEATQGDITRQQDMDAVVNAANAQLLPGGGVAGAIHRAAGPKLAEACAPLAPISPGEAVITPAFNLPNRYVIHCLGPVYGQDRPEAQLLAQCYRRAMVLATEKGLESVAFPAISAGAFGYPLEAALRIAAETLTTLGRSGESVPRVRMVLFDESTRAVFERLVREVAGA